MLEKYFSAPKTLQRLRSGISGAYIDTFADMLDRMAIPLQAPFDTFEQQPISAASSRRTVVFSPPSIPPRSTPLTVTSSVAGALISREER